MFFTHVFVIVRVDLFLQQRQQGVHSTGKLFLLHLHEQAADLSSEAPQAGLGGGGATNVDLSPTSSPSGKSVNEVSASAYLLCVQPRGDESEQDVLVVQVQLGEQHLDSHGSHFFAACRVVVNHDEGQRGKEQTVVRKQQLLNGENKSGH